MRFFLNFFVSFLQYIYFFNTFKNSSIDSYCIIIILFTNIFYKNIGIIMEYYHNSYFYLSPLDYINPSDSYLKSSSINDC